ncbi:HEAT repeat domain-containing protein [Gordonia sp. NPDC003429]
MSKVDDYRRELAALPDDVNVWFSWLGEQSNLPGPRANLSLLAAFVEEAAPAMIHSAAAADDEYLACCGAAGLGRLLAEQTADRDATLVALRAAADDPRWRVREGAAMGLQRWADDDPRAMAAVALDWAGGPEPLVARAAAAGICEPRLLRDPGMAAAAIEVCERATALIRARPADRRRDPDLRVLRQGLGYCWSVAVAADPDHGLDRFTALRDDPDPDVAWIVRTNLRKARLARLSAD